MTHKHKPKTQRPPPPPMVKQGGREGGVIMASRCQDCGNQAKKECVYMRCRTCCKSKGFHCQTHVKSTWVPVYRRRHQQLPAAAIPQQHLQLHHEQGHHHQNPKRPAEHLTNPSSSTRLDQEVNFPAEVNSMATFRCVRMSSVEDMVDQHAYQTSVVIGGHIFKGILYDQGPDHHPQNCYTTVGQSSSSSSHHVLLNKKTSNFINAAANTASTSSAPGPADQVPHHHPPSSYPLIPFNAFMPGTQFFINPK